MCTLIVSQGSVMVEKNLCGHDIFILVFTQRSLVAQDENNTNLSDLPLFGETYTYYTKTKTAKITTMQYVHCSSRNVSLFPLLDVLETTSFLIFVGKNVMVIKPQLID